MVQTTFQKENFIAEVVKIDKQNQNKSNKDTQSQMKSIACLWQYQ